MRKVTTLLVGVVLCFACYVYSQNYTILHNFEGAAAVPPDGKQPYGNLVSYGNTLYGMTFLGGAAGTGTIFSIDNDGSNYTILHNFSAFPTDGATPWGSLILEGDTLYGMTLAGGTNAGGTAFSIDTDGSNYNFLHEFLDPAVANDGATPFGSLASDGSKLYGMTIAGGANAVGVLFSMNIDGTGYAIHHHFGDPAVPNDGSAPYDSLILEGNTLYGMTLAGGANGGGTAFSIDTNGANYNILHNFPASATDGTTPYGSLYSDGSRLYGMTYTGGAGWNGANYNGTIFSMNTDGSGYTTLHSFSTGPDDGDQPYGSLISDGSKLYGMTYYGGAYGKYYGTVFSIDTDGSNFDLLHSFAGRPGDGMKPWGSLVSDGTALYGMTRYGGSGGALPGYGVIFSYALPTPTPTPTPLIDLSVNKTTFSTTDRITVTADVAQTSTQFYPYVSIRLPNGIKIYYVRGSGFTSVPTPYLSGGPFVVRNPISGYRVLDVPFSVTQTGTFVLEGFGNDVFGSTIGNVDQEQLTVN